MKKSIEEYEKKLHKCPTCNNNVRIKAVDFEGNYDVVCDEDGRFLSLKMKVPRENLDDLVWNWNQLCMIRSDVKHTIYRHVQLNILNPQTKDDSEKYRKETSMVRNLMNRLDIG